MSLFGPVTDAEHLGWQLVATDLLHDYLHTAHGLGLPAIRWSVTPAAGSLIGHATTREEWTAWQGLLQLTDVRPEVVRQPYAHLRASGRGTTSRGRSVHVTLIATVDLTPDDLDDPDAT